MQPAGRKGYSNDQVETFLKRSGLTHTFRIDLLNNNFVKLDEIRTIPKRQGGADVTIDMNVDTKLKMNLKLTMYPDSRLVGVTSYKYFFRPVYLLKLPNGTWLEFPLGVFVWNVPARKVNPKAESWTVSLPDQLFLLDSQSPGIGGWGALQDEPWTHALERLALNSGITDLSGIVPSDATLGQTMQWGLVRVEYPYGLPVIPALPSGSPAGGAKQRTTTMLDIGTDLTNGLSYYSPYFDLNGRFICRPQDDLRMVKPAVVYGSASDSITFDDITTDNDLTRIANRVIVFSDNSSGPTYPMQADADWWYPDHPWAPKNIAGPNGPRYLDKQISDSTADDPSKAWIRAFSELGQALSYYETIAWSTEPWPLHEAFDPCGMFVPGDAELGTTQLYHERTWSFDLGQMKMHHVGRRIFQPVVLRPYPDPNIERFFTPVMP